MAVRKKAVPVPEPEQTPLERLQYLRRLINDQSSTLASAEAAVESLRPWQRFMVLSGLATAVGGSAALLGAFVGLSLVGWIVVGALTLVAFICLITAFVTLHADGYGYNEKSRTVKATTNVKSARIFLEDTKSEYYDLLSRTTFELDSPI